DTYNPYNLDELRKFYDRYLKDIHNGWEMMPKVRIDVMDAYDVDYQEQRAETAWPIKRTEYRKLYLDATTALESVETDHVQTFVAGTEPVEAEGVAKYNPVDEEVRFEWVLPEDVEITGHMTLHLWLECEGWDDMDLFINIQKASADGTWIPWITLDEPHPGAWGKCRASRRELDTKLTRPHRPVLKNTSSQKLSAGEVVPVDIAIVPTSRVYHKGERFRIQIAGRYIREGWFEPLAWDEEAKGTHVIHTGGQYDSWIEIPVIPPRYQAGEYIHR
ncbi:MAG: acyl esterase, partial [Atopobiaceae bacterium]|nr:acyl esterase [Atopobiaceae bacterium]